MTGGVTSRIDPAIEYAKGFTDLNLGRFASAEADFTTALRVDPRNPKTLFMLGEAKVALGDLKGAEWAFDKALKYDPQQIVVRGEYAVTLAKLGQADQAQAQLTVLQRQGRRLRRVVPAGRRLQGRGRPDPGGLVESRKGQFVIMSLRSLASAVLVGAFLLLAPGWAAAQDHVAGRNAAAAGGIAPGGANNFDAAPQTGMPKPKIDPAIEYARGFTDFNLGRFVTAQDEFNLSLKVDANNPRTLFMLGEAKVALGDPRGAARAFEKALKNDPQQIVVRGEYALVLVKLGQAGQARAQLSILQARAVACDGSCPQADDFKAEVDRNQAALSNPEKANS